MSRFSLIAQIQLRGPQNVGAVVSSIRQQLQGITATVNVAVPPQSLRALTTVNKAVQQTTKVTKEASTGITHFGEQAALAGKRFLAFALTGGLIIKTFSAFKTGIAGAIAFERELVKVSQATGSTLKSLSGLTNEITRLSTIFGTSSPKLVEVSRILSQAGLSAGETTIALEALAKSDLAPTFGDIIDTTEASIALMRQFSLETKDLEGSLGSINAVAAKFAVESDDIAAAIRRTGGAFAAAGGNLNDLMSLFTSVRATTRESAESIATGFRTIFTRLQRVRTQDFLGTLGIDLRDLEGQFVGPYEAIRKLSIAMKNLPGTDPRFSQIIEELGGFRQVSKVIPLIKQFEVAEKARGVAIAGTASLSIDAATAQQALAIQIQKVREEFLAMIRKFTDTASFKQMIGAILKIANAFIRVTESLAPLLPMLTILGALGIGTAIKPLVQGFSKKGGFGFGMGFGNRYAAGGIVPGVGNKDSVPARLTPGEYVLRKKAVRQIGIKNLQNLNKGGIVQPFAEGGEFGEVFLHNFKFRANKGKDPVSNRRYEIEPKHIQADIGKYIGPENKIVYNDAGKHKTVIMETGSLSIEDGAKVRKISEGQIKANIDEIAKSLYNGPLIGSTDIIPNLRGIQGSLFEGAILRMGAAFTKEGSKSAEFSHTRTFDFPGGLGNTGEISKLFDNPKLNNIPVEAKMIQTGTEQDIKARVIHHIADELLEKKRAYDFAIIPATQAARGGLMRTPNAMLTPGEMVIGKEDVSRIGVNTLNSLNKSGKLPRFAGGGGFGFVPKLTKRGGAEANVGHRKQYLIQRLDFLKEGKELGVLQASELQELMILQARVNALAKSRGPRYADYVNSGRVRGFAKGGPFSFAEQIPKDYDKRNTMIPLLLNDIGVRDELRKRLQVENLEYVGSGWFGVAFKDLLSGNVIRIEDDDIQRVQLPELLQAIKTEKFKIERAGKKKTITVEHLPFQKSFTDIDKDLGRKPSIVSVREAQERSSTELKNRVRDLGFRAVDLHYGNYGPTKFGGKQIIDPGSVQEPIEIDKARLNNIYAKFAKKIRALAKVKSEGDLRGLRRSAGKRIGDYDYRIDHLPDDIIDTPEGLDRLKKLKKLRSNAVLSEDIMVMSLRKKLGFGKMAQGGEVPAILNRGEYVVNKNAASRIGIGTLDSLNDNKKLPRFHKGGTVRSFAGGGLNLGLGNLAGAGFAISGISSLVDNFIDLDGAAQDVLNVITKMASQFGLLLFTVKSLGNHFGKFDQKMEAAQSRIEVSKAERKNIAEQIPGMRENIGILRQKKTDVLIRENARQKLMDDQLNETRQKRIALGSTAQYLNAPEYQRLAKQESLLKSAKNQSISRINAADLNLLQGQEDLDRLRVQGKALKDRITVENQLIKTQQKAQKAMEAMAFGTALVAAGLSALGSYLEKEGLADIESGGRGRSFIGGQIAGKAGTGVGLGAAAGAAIGSLVPVIGTAIGGLIGAAAGGIGGGIYGKISGEKELKNRIALRDFNKELTQATQRLKSLADNKTDLDSQRSFIKSFVKNSRETLSKVGITQETRQDITSNLKTQLDSLTGYLNLTSKASKTFDEFLDKAGKEVVNFVADLSDRSRADLLKQYKEEIKSREELIAKTKAMAVLEDEYANRIRNLINVSRAFEDVSLSMKELRLRADNLFTLAGGGTAGGRILDQSARLGTPEQFFDMDRFRAELNRSITNNPILDTTFPGQTSTLASSMSSDIEAAAQTVRDLPVVLLKLRNSIGAFTSENAVEKLLAEFDKSPKFIRDSIEIVADNIIGDEGREEKLISRLQNDLPGVAKEMGDSFKPIFENAAMVASKMNEEVNARLDFVDKLIDLSGREVEARNRRIDIESESERLLSTAFGRQVDLKKLSGLEGQKQKNILGPFAGLANNPTAIGTRLEEEKNKLLAAQNKLATESFDIDGKRTEEIRKSKEAVTKLTAGLQFLTDVGGRTAITMEKIDREQSKARQKTDLLDKVLSLSSLDEARKMALEMRSTRVAARTGNINDVIPEFRPGVMSMLQSLPQEETFGFLGGKTPKAVVEALRSTTAQQAGFSKEDADKMAAGSTSELENLRKELATIIDLSKKAQLQVISSLESSQTKLLSELTNSISSFVNELRAILEQQKIQSLEKEVAGKRGTLANLETSFGNMTELANLLRTGVEPLSDSQLKAIKNNLPDIEELYKALKSQGDLGTFSSRLKDLQKGGGLRQQVLSVGLPKQPGQFASDLYDTTGMRGSDQRELTKTDFETKLVAVRDFVSKRAKGDEEALAAFDKGVQDSARFDDKRRITRSNFFDSIDAGLEGLNIAIEKRSRDIGGIHNRVNTNLGFDLSTEQLDIIGGDFKNISEKFKTVSDSLTTAELAKQINELGTSIHKTVESINVSYKNLIRLEAPDVMKSIGKATTPFSPNPFSPIIPKKQKGGLMRFAKGGIVPGHGNKDSVLSLLTPGETVIPKMARGGLLYERRKRREELYLAGKEKRKELYGRIQPKVEHTGTAAVRGLSEKDRSVFMDQYDDDSTLTVPQFKAKKLAHQGTNKPLISTSVSGPTNRERILRYNDMRRNRMGFSPTEWDDYMRLQEMYGEWTGNTISLEDSKDRESTIPHKKEGPVRLPLSVSDMATRVAEAKDAAANRGSLAFQTGAQKNAEKLSGSLQRGRQNMTDAIEARDKRLSAVQGKYKKIPTDVTTSPTTISKPIQNFRSSHPFNRDVIQEGASQQFMIDARKRMAESDADTQRMRAISDQKFAIRDVETQNIKDETQEMLGEGAVLGKQGHNVRILRGESQKQYDARYKRLELVNKQAYAYSEQRKRQLETPGFGSENAAAREVERIARNKFAGDPDAFWKRGEAERQKIRDTKYNIEGQAPTSIGGILSELGGVYDVGVRGANVAGNIGVLNSMSGVGIINKETAELAKKDKRLVDFGLGTVANFTGQAMIAGPLLGGIAKGAGALGLGRGATALGRGVLGKAGTRMAAKGIGRSKTVGRAIGSKLSQFNVAGGEYLTQKSGIGKLSEGFDKYIGQRIESGTAKLGESIGISSKPVYGRTPFERGSYKGTPTNEFFNQRYNKPISKGARAEGDRLRAAQEPLRPKEIDDLIKQAEIEIQKATGQTTTKVPATLGADPKIRQRIPATIVRDKIRNRIPATVGIPQTGYDKYFGQYINKAGGKLYGLAEKMGMTNKFVGATGKTTTRAPINFTKGRKIIGARRSASISTEADQVVGMKGRTSPLTFSSTKETRAYLVDWAKKMGIDEKLLPLGRGDISFEAREFARKLAKYNKGRTIPKTARGITQGTKTFFDPAQGAPATTVRHEGMHVIQNKLGKSWSDPKIQSKIDKLIEPVRQKLIEAGAVGDNLSTNEITARIMGHYSLAPQLVKRIRRIAGFQSGSLVPGSGSGDKIPAMLEPNEYVLNRNAVSAIGVGNLDKINNKYKRFQQGGVVGANQTSQNTNVNFDLSLLQSVVQNFSQTIDNFANAANSLNGLEISLTARHDISVTFLGTSIFNELQPSIKNLVVETVNNAINNFVVQKFNGKIGKIGK
jgi:hypothetical protein